jgi:hypothetical protein
MIFDRKNRRRKRRQKKYSKQNSVAKEGATDGVFCSAALSSNENSDSGGRRAVQAAFYNEVPKSGKSHKIPEIPVVGVVAAFQTSN